MNYTFMRLIKLSFGEFRTNLNSFASLEFPWRDFSSSFSRVFFYDSLSGEADFAFKVTFYEEKILLEHLIRLKKWVTLLYRDYN